jgi:hypothetical protein
LGRTPLRLLITNPKKYSELIRELRKRGVPLSDKHGIVVRDQDLGEDLLSAIGGLVALSLGKRYFEEISVGIDTNTSNKLTAVIVGDGEILEWARTDLESVCNYVRTALRIYPHKKHVVGVGAGNVLGLAVFERLHPCLKEVKLVNESRTSRRNVFLNGNYPEDVIAGYNIAMRAL